MPYHACITSLDLIEAWRHFRVVRLAQIWCVNYGVVLLIWVRNYRHQSCQNDCWYHDKERERSNEISRMICITHHLKLRCSPYGFTNSQSLLPNFQEFPNLNFPRKSKVNEQTRNSLNWLEKLWNCFVEKKEKKGKQGYFQLVKK